MVAPDVTVTELLSNADGCHGLHQRIIGFGTGGLVTGVAGGIGEAWYVTAGTGLISPGPYALAAGSAIWLPGGTGYEATGDGLRVVAVTVLAGSPVDAPAHLVRFEDCEPEWTGDRQFRVLLSAGLTVTAFVGVIPPGRAPTHQHTYDEVVHVLAGAGVVHLPGGDRPIGAGSSVYLAPGTPHCLENTGMVPLEVLGVFHPAGSPAEKTIADRADA